MSWTMQLSVQAPAGIDPQYEEVISLAMERCKACGGRVSGQANNCVHCGAMQLQIGTWVRVLMALVAALLLVSLFGVASWE